MQVPAGIEQCSVALEITNELPGLGLLACTASCAGKSSAGVVQELDLLAQRLNGPKAVRTSTEPVAAAYRALRVGLGMDPEADVASLESVVRRRLVEGGFRTAGQPEDAITIATLETGVPIQAVRVKEGQWSLGVDENTGAVSILLGSEAVTPVFAQPGPDWSPARDDASAILLAAVAPGVEEQVVALALDRARTLTQS